MAVKLNLDALHKLSKEQWTSAPKTPQKLRSRLIIVLFVGVPAITFLLGGQIYMLAYPDTLLDEPLSDFLIPLIGLQGFLSIFHIGLLFTLNIFPTLLLAVMKLLRPQLMTKELSMTFD